MTWLVVIVINTGTITLPQRSKNHCLGAMATAIDRAYRAAKDRGEFHVYSAQCVDVAAADLDKSSGLSRSGRQSQ